MQFTECCSHTFHIVGEGEHFADCVAELHHFNAIDGPDQTLHETPGGILLHVEIFVDAATRVDGEHDGKRECGVSFKQGDLLRLAVFLEQEIFPLEVRDGCAVLILDVDKDVYQVDVDLDGQVVVAG